MTKKIGMKELMAEGDSEALVESLSFEEALQLLEQLVEKVEAGNLSLDHSILAYERGVSLVERLRGLLNQAESKLKILGKEDAQ